MSSLKGVVSFAISPVLLLSLHYGLYFVLDHVGCCSGVILIWHSSQYSIYSSPNPDHSLKVLLLLPQTSQTAGRGNT